VSVVAAEPSVREVLDKALDGERISEEDAVALLRSRDLVGRRQGVQPILGAPVECGEQRLRESRVGHQLLIAALDA